MEIIKCTTKDHLVDHYIIRKLVFIDEQNVSYEDEFDLEEKTKIPFILYLNNKPIGAARLNNLNDSVSKIERVCILKEYRGKNYGLDLVNYLINYSKNNNIKEIIIGAQTQAMGFYEKLGFIKYGDKYLDANIPHYKMKKNL